MVAFRRFTGPLAVAAIAALVISLLVETTQFAQPAEAAPRNYSFAVVGDMPYSQTQRDAMPTLVKQVNKRKRVFFTVHVGDIKPGGTPCTDAYFNDIKGVFDTFKRPMMFTPGDNEWTDCHRTSAGKYDPLERLAKVREVFFADPSQSNGRNPMALTSQGEFGFAQVENQMWTQPGVVFATVHAVGSFNGQAPWFTDDPNDNLVDDPDRRLAEVASRNNAARAWVTDTFQRANDEDAEGVVIFMQANPFNILNAPRVEHQALVDHIAGLAHDFGKPVLLIGGDTHSFVIDKPLANYDPQARKFRRIIVEGSTVSEFLRVKVDFRKSRLFTVKRIRF